MNKMQGIMEVYINEYGEVTIETYNDTKEFLDSKRDAYEDDKEEGETFEKWLDSYIIDYNDDITIDVYRIADARQYKIKNYVDLMVQSL